MEEKKRFSDHTLTLMNSPIQATLGLGLQDRLRVRAGTAFIVQPDLRSHRSTATPNELPLRPVPNDHSALHFLEIPRNSRTQRVLTSTLRVPLFQESSAPGENRRPRRDNLGKELRVLEHARGVAGVARGLRRGGAAALELEHRTEHRRKSQERLRELHR
mgnify:CR=1 FL=1